MSKLIPLTKGFSAIVDDADFDWLSRWKWQYNPDGYASRTTWIGSNKTTSIKMHRAILDITDKKIHTDHINGNRLDNQRSNLRACTSSQNAMNRHPKKGSSSQYKGVGWHQHTQKWQAFVFDGKRKIHLGVYTSEIEAAHARDKAARIYHGEFAKLNFHECSSCNDLTCASLCAACQEWAGRVLAMEPQVVA